MRIQVIANCQARPISAQLSRFMPCAELLEPLILHLSKDAEREAHLEQCAEADIIFAQLTTNNFQPNHLASQKLKDRFGEKVVIWPNIFYSGQQPYLRYFTHPTAGRLLGPLEALHDIRLFQSWQSTGHVNINALSVSDPKFERQVHEASLASLRRKETACDVTISDFIATQDNTQRLFFTFNHPSRSVLSEMARRLLAHLGQKPNIEVSNEGPEPLDRYQVPSSWTGPDPVFQGDSYEISSEGYVKRLPGPARKYDTGALCAAFQQVYDNQHIYRTPDRIRVTPDFIFSE
jgi:hypothetical protein